MKLLTQVLLALFWKLGGPGLLVLGILDSSFLFAPLGNDLLVVALSAWQHSIPFMLYYAGMSTLGEVLGSIVSVVGWTRRSRKATGERNPGPGPTGEPRSAPEPEPRALR